MARKTVEIVPTPAGLSGYTAELGAAIIGAMIGLAPYHLEDHATYIADWLKAVRDEPRVFFSAAAKAQAAVDWLIDHAGPLDAGVASPALQSARGDHAAI